MSYPLCLIQMSGLDTLMVTCSGISKLVLSESFIFTTSKKVNSWKNLSKRERFNRTFILFFTETTYQNILPRATRDEGP